MTKPPLHRGPRLPPADLLGALQRAVQAHGRGNLVEAEALYQLVLTHDKRQFDALNMLGVLHGQRRNYDEAVRLVERALGVNPRSAEAYANLGRLQFEMGELQRAAASYAKSLAIKPDFALAHSNYSALLRTLRRPQEALSHCDKALAAQPNFVNALSNRGNALFDLRRYDDALAAYDKTLSLAPNMPEAWLGRGNALTELTRHVEAQSAYDKALALNPGLADAWLGRANVLAALTRHVEAQSAYDRALALNPGLVDAWLGRGNVLMALWRYEAAGASCERALAHDPNSAKAWLGWGTALQALRRYEETVAACERALAIDPDIAYAEGLRLLAKFNICDWGNFDSDCSRLAAGVNRGARVTVPFTMMCATSSSSDQLECARLFAADKYPPAPSGVSRRGGGAHDRIRVAYLSADFRDHPVSYLLAGLFEHHDRSQFRTVAISFGPDDRSKMRDRVKGAFESFVDVETRTDSEVAELLRELEVDIAVDLMGLTQGCRTGIFARRPAPIQVNYLGYPGTMGADYIDYIFADRFVIPKDQCDRYAEKVVYLPDTFQANDRRRSCAERTPSRSECGLPEDAFVFCAFNANHKITPSMFDIWMRLLGDVEGSVLWLVSNKSGVEDRLRREAASRGIGADRLLFAPRIDYADYLARYRCADLFLDTLPFNGGTTVSDSLWAGLPVVACSGEAFAARMAGSLLESIGLPELATESLQHYEDLARKLATDRSMLAGIKARLAANRGTCPLFDTDRFRRHIESAYHTMHDRHRRGEPPERFAVAAIEPA
jgi:protein O-GlcNAc transferase